MRRDQLEHAIRTACQIIGADAVIVIGSQAILGSVDEGLLPPEATMSLEVDILPIAADEPSTVELADRIEGVAGEWSLSRRRCGRGRMATLEDVAQPAVGVVDELRGHGARSVNPAFPELVQDGLCSPVPGWRTQQPDPARRARRKTQV
jgi:hypothetical protein